VPPAVWMGLCVEGGSAREDECDEPQEVPGWPFKDLLGEQ